MRRSLVSLRPFCPSLAFIAAALLYLAPGAGAHELDDADLDGFHDAADNCINTVNPSQRDSDGDGFGDACDMDLNNDGLTKTSSTPEYLISCVTSCSIYP